MKLNTLLHSELANALATLIPGGTVTKAILELVKDGVAPNNSTSNPTLITMAAAAALEKVQQRVATNTAAGAMEESPKPHESGFKFGSKSLVELNGAAGKPEVCTDLARVVTLALRRSTRDFMVFEGSRTLAKQKEYVAKGTSKTLKSAHLPQADGTSHAVDLVPIVNGVPSWADWEAIYQVAWAMDQAATELGVADRIVWGCAWDRRLSDFGGSQKDYAMVAAAYGDRQRAAGNNHPLIDGPHFEWR